MSASSFEVRPQINSSGSIKLFLHQQVNSIAGPVSNDNSDLILNKREVETTLTVDDGEIAVIGGLLDDNERRTIEKIPFLGDLPGLGALFRSKTKARTKTNLMVFIRPTILRTVRRQPPRDRAALRLSAAAAGGAAARRGTEHRRAGPRLSGRRRAVAEFTGAGRNRGSADHRAGDEELDLA